MIYHLLKRVIARGGIDKADLRNKLTVYRACNKLSQEQYDELSALVDAAA